ncbi:hypothetical protein [Streptodolium elevatio]|uniref:Uncharacterized protein n=1 Tax=Streptodolium elevatio TaxID=3157996 RepID=A0ABV3DSC1_9ACTN
MDDDPGKTSMTPVGHADALVRQFLESCVDRVTVARAADPVDEALVGRLLELNATAQRDRRTLPDADEEETARIAARYQALLDEFEK